MVLRSSLLLISLWSTWCSWCLGQESQPAGSVQTIDLGNRRELFVDRFLIDTLDGLSHKLHEPKATEPMEQPADAMEYGTIIKDGPLFRMYTRDGRGARFDGDQTEVTRYCESTDGIHWTKPNLGLVQVDGSNENNVVLSEPPYCHNFAPFLDENPAAPNEARFKALAGTVKSGLVAFQSADGIRWSKMRHEPVIQYTKEYAFDSQNVAFWSVHEGLYVCYFRHFLEGKLRSICRTTSKNFIDWTEPIAMRPNLPDEHLYTSLTHPYFRAPHIYIATPTRFFPNQGDRTDILFMSARGDQPFDRTFRQAFLRPGLDSDRWGNRANYAAWHIVQTSDSEMSLYTTPFRRFTLRLDGFASIHADADAGRMTTKVFTMAGDRLVINASTSAAGSIRVELTDPQGTPIEGFAFKDCQTFVGDAIDATVTWSSRPGLRSLAGRPIRARFELIDADLYALHFPLDESSRVDFRQQVRPILEQRCFACHGALKQEADLRLDSATAIHQGSSSGPVIDTKAAGSSELVRRILSQDPQLRMPPEGHSLAESQIQTILAWIEQGAPVPQIDTPEPDPNAHWAFQIPVRPKIPDSTASSNAPIHPVDAFLQESWQSEGLVGQPQADPHTRLRRVYIDLIGLPPSPESLADFCRNPSQENYEKIVDKLLASPMYAERWARHWMDVWRYADWFGRRYVPDVWNSAPQVWRWRDWIVESLNADTGYDQMVTQMLAADEVNPGDPKSNVATGYLVRNWYALNPNDWMRSNVEHSSKAFLGLTFHCAHCHDHKYDPISQENYFQLRAFFEPIAVRQDRLAGQPDPGPFQEYEYSTLRKVQRLGRVGIYDKSLDSHTWLYTSGDERNRQTDRGSILPNVPDFLKAAFEQPIEPVPLPTTAWYPGLDPEILKTVLLEADQAIAQAQSELDASTAASLAAQVEASKPDASKPDARRTPEQEALETTKSLERQIQELQDARRPEESGVLSGQQSLLMDASQGRRMIYRSVPEIPSIQEDDRIEFLVQILADTHWNFQLTRDNSTGATATYIGFEKGQIKSYKPASFDEFEVGKFDPETPQVLAVELTLHPKDDRCTLKVYSREDQRVLVDGLSVALNGWNPVGDPTKGILFDARPGSIAAIDDWRYRRKSSNGVGPAESVLEFTFEAPELADKDLVGILDWTSAQNYSIAPARSVMVRKLPSLNLSKLQQELARAQRAIDRMRLPTETARAKLESSQANRRQLVSRIEAERLKYMADPSSDPESIQRTAHRAMIDEKKADFAKQRIEWNEARKQLADAEAKPHGDANRAKELDAANARWAKAQVDFEAIGQVLEQCEQIAPEQATYKPLSPQYPRTSTGRRRALAAWIASPKNPLTARVGVNHIWMRHFHEPLVKTVFDFGRNGSLPTHPKLLDWLAVEWMESGWSMKHLHRLLVTSQAYQRESVVAENPSQNKDPQNQKYWRMNAGRMEVEVLRDSILEIAGKLDPKMGGQELENKDMFSTSRRTLYYSCQPEEDGKSALGMLFDGPDASDCYRRTRTVIPQQSLALTNSPLVHEVAPQIAQRIELSLSQTDRTDAGRFLDAAYTLLLNRPATLQERELCLDYLDSASDSTSQRSSLIRVLLNHNDFITIR